MILRVLLINVIIVLALSWLIVLGQVPLVPAVSITIPALFVVDVLLMWKTSRRLAPSPVRSAARRKWIALVLVAGGDIAVITSWIDRPSIPLAVEAVIGTVAVGAVWYFLFSAIRRKPQGLDQQHQNQSRR